MKKIIQITIIFLLLFLVIAVSIHIQAQPLPPGGDPTVDKAPVGGSSPIGGGLGVLMLLAGAYAVKKFREEKKKDS